MPCASHVFGKRGLEAANIRAPRKRDLRTVEHHAWRGDDRAVWERHTPFPAVGVITKKGRIGPRSMDSELMGAPRLGN